MSRREWTPKKRSHRNYHRYYYYYYYYYHDGPNKCQRISTLAALLLIFTIGISQGENVTVFDESEIEKSVRESNHSKFPFIRYSESDGRYRGSKKGNVSEAISEEKEEKGDKETDSKSDGTEDTGKFPFLRLSNYEDANVNGSKDLIGFTQAPKIDNSTRSSYKRQKNFFRTKIFHTSSRKNDTNKIIAILGLYELSTIMKNSENKMGESEEGKSELWAAKLAVDHVNERKLFGGYQIKLYANDTKCDPGVAVDTFFHAIFSRDMRIPILLGTACSEATASLAYIVPYWNIVQISFGATSPVLSDRKEFPMFYRVVASESSHNSARVAFVRHFNWRTVTVLSQNEKEYTLAVNDLAKKLEQENITHNGTVTFGKNDYQDQLQLLKVQDRRIIFGSFSKEIAPKIFCKVQELGMYGSDYVWILQGNLNDVKWKWWENQTHCPKRRLKEAIQGLIFVSTYYESNNSDSSFQHFMNDKFKYELLRSRPIERYARESYDAVWTAAIALNESIQYWSQFEREIKMEEFDYHRFDISKRIFNQISQTNFTGISGPISFQGADRIGTSAFYQLLGRELRLIALYRPSEGVLQFECSSCKKIIWAGGQVPVSQRFEKQRIETISTEAFIAVTFCTSLAIVLGIVFLVFNLYFRKLKHIKLSSPKLNNIAVVGCIAVYIGIFLLGFDHATFPDVNYFPVICTAKVYFFAAGFSLAFGSIFAKTYRIHKIFIRSQGGFVKKKFLQDTQLILLVCVLLLIDGLILTLWVVIDPMERRLHNLTKEYSTEDRSVVYQPQVEVCSCEHLNSWLCSLYIYKGLQLLMGVYMAWETRHVKIPGLNDSQYIGMSVYSVVITSCIVVVLANLISERPTVAYVTISTMILSSTTATLCLLFFPKLRVIFSRTDNSTDPVMQSMGLKLESNTRRFVTDDAKEKLYRLEVQNRVFKREVVALRAEIMRLEKQLLQSISRTDSPTSEASSARKAGTEKFEADDSSPKTVGLEIVPLDDNQTIQTSKTPRSSWPSEFHAILNLKRSHSFHSERKLERLHLSLEGGLTYRVIERIRNLMKTKKMDENRTKKKDGNEIIFTIEDQSQDQRKFSLTKCLQSSKSKQSNKDVIIDLNVSSSEDIRDFNVFGLSRVRLEDRKNQKSNSSFPARAKIKGSPRFPHRIVPTNSLTMLGDISDRSSKKPGMIFGKEDFGSIEEKSRSLDDTRNVIFHDAEISPEDHSVI